MKIELSNILNRNCMRFENIKDFGYIELSPCSQLLLYKIAFSPYKLVLLLHVLATVDFEIFFLKSPNNLLCKKAGKKEEGKNLSKVVLTFLGMAFLLGFMNDCGEITLEPERNLQRSSNTSSLFYKSMFTLYYISINLKIQSTIYLV